MNAPYATALQAAREAAGAQHFPKPALYVVATPIGNLADITLRALHVLQLADAIACEDTRHTGALLRGYGIEAGSQRLFAAHRHNEAGAADGVLARLRAGERVALVSDAGTPALSDPGARVVAAAREAGFAVLAIPGASSIAAAWSTAGAFSHDGATEGFVFAGFLPSRGAERAGALAALGAQARGAVLLEAPHRIEALAQSIATLGDRPVTVARELSKQFEQSATMPANALSDWLRADAQRARGEFVVVVHPAPHAGNEAAQGMRVLERLMRELPLKTAVALAAEITGAPRNALYAAALEARAANGVTPEADPRRSPSG